MEKEKIQELLEYATTLYSSNISIEDIEKAMIKQGADEELAKEIVRTVDIGQRKEQSSRGKYAMIIGAGVLFIGVFQQFMAIIMRIMVKNIDFTGEQCFWVL